MRSIEGALRGLPEGSCLYQYTRVMSGFELPRQKTYSNPVTHVFVDDRVAFLEKTAGFRRIDLKWCLTLEPSKLQAFERKPQKNAADTSRMLAELQKSATILEGHLGSLLGLRLLDRNSVFQFFSYLFNLEKWAEKVQLRDDTGVDRQIVAEARSRPLFIRLKRYEKIEIPVQSKYPQPQCCRDDLQNRCGFHLPASCFYLSAAFFCGLHLEVYYARQCVSLHGLCRRSLYSRKATRSSTKTYVWRYIWR